MISQSRSTLMGNNSRSQQNGYFNSAVANYLSSRNQVGSSYISSKNQSDASKYSADRGAESSRYAADQQRAASEAASNANRYGADRGLDSSRLAAEANRYGSDQQRAAAEASAKANMYGADRGLDSTRLQTDASRYGAELNYEGRMGEAEINSKLGRYVSNNNLAGQRYSSDQQRIASNYASDQRLRGDQVAANAQLSGIRMVEGGKDRRFDSSMGMIDKYLPQGLEMMGTALGNGTGGDVGYSASGQPAISNAPVYTPQQIAAQRASMFDQAQQQAATQTSDAANSFAGRGLGANSPLLAALSTNFQHQALGRASDNALQFGINASRENADHRLASSIAQEGQYASRRGEALQGRRDAMNYHTGLLGALSSMLGGI